MNYTDAIEGVIKSIISKYHEVFIGGSLDDSEYIRNVKIVLHGTDEFVQANLDFKDDLESLREEFYQFAKNLWLSDLKKRLGQNTDSEDQTKDDTENDDYYEYYFDYLYAHDTYPK